jgi:hypothetical protein
MKGARICASLFLPSLEFEGGVGGGSLPHYAGSNFGSVTSSVTSS